MLGQLLTRGTRYVCVLAFGAVLACAFLAEPALNIWLGKDYAFLAPYALIVFASYAFVQTTSCAHHILRGLGRMRISLLNSVVGNALLPITLCVVVLLTTSDSYWAITIGLSVSAVVYAVMQLLFTTRVVRVKLSSLIWQAYVPSGVTATLFYVVQMLFIWTFGIENALVVAFITFASLSCALLFFGAFLSTEEEKTLVINLFQRVRVFIPFL